MILYFCNINGVSLNDSFELPEKTDLVGAFLKLYDDDCLDNFMYLFRTYMQLFKKEITFGFISGISEFIYRIYVDEQKNEARETTVTSQYLTSKITKDESEKKANKKYGIIGISRGIIFFVIIVLLDIFFTIGLVKTEEDTSSIFWGCVGMLGFILFGAVMTFFFIFGNVISLKENKSLNKEIKKK